MRRMFEVISAEFEIVTPMFLGGSGQEISRIRMDSLMGALAFWWRALHFSRYVAKASTLDDALAKMRHDEVCLFGGVGGDSGQAEIDARQARVQPRLRDGSQVSAVKLKAGVLKENAGSGDGASTHVIGVGARYLGFGLVVPFDTRAGPPKGTLLRGCFCGGVTFTVDFLLRDALSADLADSFKAALKLFGLLGGLGSRVRRGWGSVSMVSMNCQGTESEVWQRPASQDAFEAEIKNLLKDTELSRGASFPLTAFAEESRVWLATHGDGQAMVAMDLLGRAFLNYRAHGRSEDKGLVGGQAVQQQFIEDHDWYKGTSNDVDLPYRSAFGLPHPYEVKGGRFVGVTASDKIERRGSPMLFHILPLGGSYVPVVTLLPTRFLPEVLDRREENLVPTKIVAKGKSKTRERTYDLGVRYGEREASGLDVLENFITAPGNAKFKSNEVIGDFRQVWGSKVTQS